jgi:hypothetical protein
MASTEQIDDWDWAQELARKILFGTPPDDEPPDELVVEKVVGVSLIVKPLPNDEEPQENDVHQDRTASPR